MFLLDFLLLFSISSVSLATVSFYSLGDWGGAALGGQILKNVKAVSNQMLMTSSSLAPSFIINTGDSFYWCGIQNTTDYQIETDWNQPYSTLQLQWYGVLGNHEYGYNPEAVVELSQINDKWIMDARYYTKRMLIDADSQTYISFIFLDTSPCISYYRSSSPSHWDPCGTDYPSCSLTSTDDDFEGKCQFNENILAQDCSLQNEWLKETIAEIPENDWLIIVGHHPIDEVDVEDMTSVIQNHGFSLYINGHTHTLTQYTVDNKGAYITSGAGSLVDTTEQYLKRNTNAEIGSSTHTYKAIFNAKVAGFTQHIFNDDFSQLQSNFISYTGEIIHSFAINRLGVEQK